MSRRWLVALAGIFVVLAPGAVYSFSLLSQPLAAAFGWASDQVSWAFALYSLFIAFGAFYGGRLSDEKGPRVTATLGALLCSGGYALCGTLSMTQNIALLYLYYGVIAGFGAGMAYIASLNAIVRWAPKQRGLGGGLVIMGFGLGSLVYGTIVRAWPPFASILASTHTYVLALANATASNQPFDHARFRLPATDVTHLMLLFAASGLAFLAISGFAACFVGFPKEDLAPETSAPNFTLRQTLGDARFYLLWAMLFLNVFGGSTIISAAVPIVNELTGLPVAAAAALYGGLAIFNGLGRLFFGALSDRIGRRATFVAIFAMQALAFILLDNAHDPVLVSVAIGLLLFAYGGGFGTMPATNADFFGTKHFGSNYGAQLSAWGLAAVSGNYFIAGMRAASGSYAGLMQPVSVVLLVALFFPLIIEAPAKPVPARGDIPATA